MEGTRKSLSFVLFVLILVKFAVSEDFQFLFKGNVCELHNVSSSSELIAKLSKLTANKNFTDALKSRNVTEFICVNTTLQSIPPALFQTLPDLVKFTASNVGLQEISFEDLNSTQFLRHLNLSRNKISRLDIKIFKHIKQLRVVDLSNNEIRSVIDSPGNFSENSTLSEKVRIEFLNLQNNKINVFNPTTLEVIELNLNNNQLEKMNYPTTVVVLEANNNKLKEIFISNSVLNLSVANNEIEVVKCGLNPSVEVLNLSGNKILSEVFVELKRARNLKSLDVSNTMLSNLAPDSFVNMRLLEELSLARTRIRKFPFGLFSQQTNLRNLNILNNNLDFIDCRWFRPLISLANFDISDNNLIKLQNCENFDEMFPKLKLINVNANSWNCNYLDHLGSLFSKFGVGFVEREVTVIDAFDIEEANDQLEDFIGAMKKFFGPLHAPKFDATGVKDPFFFVLKTNFEFKINKILGKPRATNDPQNHEIYERFWKILTHKRETDSSDKSLSLTKINVRCDVFPVPAKKNV